MRTFVKLTGLTTPEAVKEVPAGGAAGFVVEAGGAPGQVDLAIVPSLVDHLTRDAEAWAVTVDPTPDLIHRLFDDVGVDRVQVYGTIPSGLEFLEIHHLVPSLPVPVDGTEGPDPMIPPAEDYSRLHLDVAGNPLADGSARQPDWEVCARLVDGQPGRKLILAGGLTAENVGDALARVRPWGVDVTHGIAGPAGTVDLGRLRAFVAAIETFESGHP